MERYQFRLDCTDPRQREIKAMLDAAAPGRRNALIVEMLLRGAGTDEPVTLDAIRSVVDAALRAAGTIVPDNSAAAQPSALEIPPEIPDDVFEAFGQI